MRFRLLACDYDGTIATDGVCSDTTRASLSRVRESGRKLILVTGRTIEELHAVFDPIGLFDALIVENGAVLIGPGQDAETLLAEPVPIRLIDELRARSIGPMVYGRVICSAHWEHRAALERAIADLGLDLEVTRNRATAMVLPPGVTKATAFAAALAALGVAVEDSVAVGDGENDISMCEAAGASLAVANAVPDLIARAGTVLDLPNGQGIAALVDSLVNDDLRVLLGAGRRA